MNGKVVEGPRWVRETHDFMSLPLLVRPNSILAIGNHDDRPDYDYAEGVTLQVYQLEDGKHAITEIPSLTGKIQMIFTVSRAGSSIVVERQGKSKPWQILLVGIPAITTAEDAVVENTPRGVLVTPASQAASLRIILP